MFLILLLHIFNSPAISFTATPSLTVNRFGVYGSGGVFGISHRYNIYPSYESITKLHYINGIDTAVLLDSLTISNETSPVKNKQDKKETKLKPKRRKKQKKPNSAVTKHKEQWNLRYQELVEFYNLNGHSSVPYNFPNSKLSRWVTNQRQYKRLNKPCMTEERIKALNKVQFRFDSRCTSWEDRFQELKQFSLIYGHCNVKTSTNRDLGNFVMSQRRQYEQYLQIRKNSERSEKTIDDSSCNLTKERVEALQLIGFDFRFQGNSKNSTWNEKYLQLKHYYKVRYDCTVPSNDKIITQWIDIQRSEYRLFKAGEKSMLTKERIDLLNDIKFVWDPIEVRFNERVEELKRFYAENQHCNVPSTVNPQLHSWIKRQRVQYQLSRFEGAKSSLTKERMNRLKEAGLDLEKDNRRNQKTPWIVKFRQLQQYVHEHGHCIVPQTHPQLGNFVRAQRNGYKLMKMGKKTSMTTERIRKLNSIGFVWQVYNRKFPRRNIKMDLAFKNNVIATKNRAHCTLKETNMSTEILLQQYEKKSLWG